MADKAKDDVNAMADDTADAASDAMDKAGDMADDAADSARMPPMKPLIRGERSHRKLSVLAAAIESA